MEDDELLTKKKRPYCLDLRYVPTSSSERHSNQTSSSTKGATLLCSPPLSADVSHLPKPLLLSLPQFPRFHRRIQSRFKEFGVFPSLCTPWLSPLQRLKDVELCGGSWWNSWIPGCRLLSVFGIPRGMTEESIIQSLQRIPMPLNCPVKINQLMILFGDESVAVNPLGPCVDGPPSGETISLAQFDCEQDARLFWSLCGAGALTLYGHRLNAYADPSGYRAFGEAVMGCFRYEDLKSAPTCACCHQGNASERSLKKQRSVLFLPLVTSLWTERHLKPILEKKKVKIQWRPDVGGAVLELMPGEPVEMFCLPQHYQFKINRQTKQMVHAAVFCLAHKVTPCIISPLQHILMPSPHLEKSFVFSSTGLLATAKRRLTLPQSLGHTTPPSEECSEQFRSSLATVSQAASKGQAEVCPEISALIKRPRGRPKGSTKKNL